MSDDQQMLYLLKSVSNYLYQGGIGDGSFAVDEIVKRYEKMKNEWIDPQRIVELAKRYTDQDRIGYVELAYYDHDDREPQWQIIRSGGAHEDARTANEALKMMEDES